MATTHAPLDSRHRHPTRLPDPNEQPFVTPEQALAALDLPLGRSSFYAAVRAGEIPGARKVGHRWLLSVAALRRWACLDPESDAR